MFSKIVSLLLISFILTSCGSIPMPTITPTLTSTPTATAVPVTATNTPTLAPTVTLTPTATPVKMFPWADKEFASLEEAKLAVEQDCLWTAPPGTPLNVFDRSVLKEFLVRDMPSYLGHFSSGTTLKSSSGDKVCTIWVTSLDDNWSHVIFPVEKGLGVYVYPGSAMSFMSP